MNALTRKIPTFHYEKSNLLRLVLFTAVFDLIFINLYKPFSSLTWYPVSEFKSCHSHGGTGGRGESSYHVLLHETSRAQLPAICRLDCSRGLFHVAFLYYLFHVSATGARGDGNIRGIDREHFSCFAFALRHVDALFLVAGQGTKVADDRE